MAIFKSLFIFSPLLLLTGATDLAAQAYTRRISGNNSLWLKANTNDNSDTGESRYRL